MKKNEEKYTESLDQWERLIIADALEPEAFQDGQVVVQQVSLFFLFVVCCFSWFACCLFCFACHFLLEAFHNIFLFSVTMIYQLN